MLVWLTARPVRLLLLFSLPLVGTEYAATLLTFVLIVGVTVQT
jgi:hypothetical protein